MQKSTWGRKELLIWPYQIPIQAFGSFFLVAVFTFLFVCGWIHFALKPLQRYYLRLYEQTSVIAAFSKTHRSDYRLLLIVGPDHRLRPALNDDLALGRTPDSQGASLPLTPSLKAKAQGDLLIFHGSLRSFSDSALHAFLKDSIYGKASLPAHFRVPLIAGAVLLMGLLPFAVLKDTERFKQHRYGRRLKGPEMLRSWGWEQRACMSLSFLMVLPEWLEMQVSSPTNGLFTVAPRRGRYTVS